MSVALDLNEKRVGCPCCSQDDKDARRLRVVNSAPHTIEALQL